MNKFKAGDKVYCPCSFTTVKTLRPSIIIEKPEMILEIRHLNFDTRGIGTTKHLHQLLFHATPENKKALETLYGMEFEDVKQR